MLRETEVLGTPMSQPYFLILPIKKTVIKQLEILKLATFRKMAKTNRVIPACSNLQKFPAIINMNSVIHEAMTPMISTIWVIRTETTLLFTGLKYPTEFLNPQKYLTIIKFRFQAILIIKMTRTNSQKTISSLIFSFLPKPDLLLVEK